MNRTDPQTANMALFCDFENVALGVREARYDQFDISRILERLLLKGSIVVKKAYCDWERYKDFKAGMHQASFELIEIPHLRISGKNSADIRMVVDALDLCYTKAHVDCFVIISGDSDFSPLVSKLRENNKTVIGVGVKNSTSDLLIKNCDEFIFYDDLVQVPKRRAAARGRSAGQPAVAPMASAAVPGTASGNAPVKSPAKAPAKVAAKAPGKAPAKAAGESPKSGTGRNGGAGAGRAPPGEAVPEAALEEAVGSSVDGADPSSSSAAMQPLLLENEPTVSDERVQRGLDLIRETVDALVAERGEDERIWGSMVKQTLKRRNPGFNETYYGFRTFNRMLEEARDRRLIVLEEDDKSGGYIVRAL